MIKNGIPLEYFQTIQLPHHTGGMNFFRSCFLCFLVEAIVKKSVNLLTKNLSVYENVVNLFEHHMET